MMRVFFDTSALLPLFWESHPNHEASLNLLLTAGRGSRACSSHTLAEVYSSLTRLPIRPRITPEQGLTAVKDLCAKLTIVELSTDDYVSAIRLLADRGFSGGVTYDALVVIAALKYKAKILYTWNLRDMDRLAAGSNLAVQLPGQSAHP